MTLTIHDISEREKTEQRRTFEPIHNDLPAVIKSVDGNTRPPSQRSMTWVAFYNQPESRVLVHNPTTNDVAETPVWVGPEARPPHRLIIKGVYYGGLSTEVDHDGGALETGPHAQTHQYPSEASPGPDKVLVFQPALQPLKMTGTGSTLIVTIRPHLYTRNGRPISFSGSTLDLTSSVPGTASTKRKTLVYLNEETNVMSVVNGPTVPTGGALIPSRPDLPVGGRMSGYVELTNGQTAITTATHIEDWRDTLRGWTNLTGSTTISPDLKNYTLAVSRDTTATGTVTLDFLVANVHDLTLTGNITLILANPPSSTKYGELKIIIRQDATGGRTVAWPTDIWWPGAVAPVMSSGIDALDVYEVITLNGGLYYLGRTLANYGAVAQTVTVSAVTLAGSAPNVAVDAPATITVNALTLAGSAPNVTVDALATISAATLTLAGTAVSITVQVSGTVLVNALTLAGSAPNITVVPGATSVVVNALTLAGSTPNIKIADETLLETGDTMLLESGDNFLLE